MPPQHVALATKWVGWVSVILFGAAGALAFRANEIYASLGFVLLMLFSGYVVLLGYNRYAIDRHEIWSRSFLGSENCIRWDEVRSVEVGTGGSLVFHGDNKRLAFPPASLWKGTYKAEMYQLLVSEVERRKLVLVRSRSADCKVSKNVKVKRAKG